MSVRPAKTRISLGIHPVWTESTLKSVENVLSWYLQIEKDNEIINLGNKRQESILMVLGAALRYVT